MRDQGVCGWLQCLSLFCLVFLSREGEEGCKKQLGRVLSIWQERGVYENNLLDQLSQVLCKFTLHRPALLSGAQPLAALAVT